MSKATEAILAPDAGTTARSSGRESSFAFYPKFAPLLDQMQRRMPAISEFVPSSQLCLPVNLPGEC
jgi:hypothetical protein